MNITNITLSKDFNKIFIVPLGDFHLGDPYFRVDLLTKTLKYIKNVPNAYTILNGDLINNAIKTSVSDTYSETMTIEEQLDTLVKMLSPIKHKILYMTQGNHEYRTRSLAGIDPLKYVATALGLLETNRYSDNSYIINLKFGKNKSDDSKNRYVIFGSHGSGTGGKRMGSTVNAMEDMTKIFPTANLYIHSHTHTPISYTDRCFTVKNNAIEPFIRTFVNTNSFLDYGGYAERFGFKAVDLAPLVVQVEMCRVNNTIRPVTTVSRMEI